MMRLARSVGLIAAGCLGLLASCGSDDDAQEPAAQGGSAGSAGQAGGDAGPSPQGLMDTLFEVTSCAFSCGIDCEEPQKPFDCPTLHPWGAIPHDTAAERCGDFDGASMPAQVQGKCSSYEPTGDAVAKTTTTGDPVILPDGRRLRPAGHWKVFEDGGIEGTFPFSALWVPGTSWVLVSDDGYGDHALRVVDAARLAADQPPVVSQVEFGAPAGLNYGLAIGADGTVYAASEQTASAVLAFQLDKATGALTRDATRDVKLQGDGADKVFPMGIGISPDGKKLISAQVLDNAALVYSLEQATYGKKLGSFGVGGEDQFAALFDPLSSEVAYVSVWNRQRVVEVNLATQSTRTIATGREPQELAFFDANYMAVAAALADEIAIVDRVAAKVVTTIPIDPDGKRTGLSPTALAYDQANQRLYATLATLNGVAVYDVTPSTGAGVPPKFAMAGAIPTAWWPTDVVVAGPTEPEPGSIVIISGKGVGTGPDLDPRGPGEGINGSQMRGAVQLVPYPDAAALSAMTAVFDQARSVQGLAGTAQVVCPDGAAYDFPVPRTNTEGPSNLIKHIVFVVRENKTYDAVMGDLPGADGDPKLVMIPGKMEEAFGNTRSIARTFSHGDNFYHDAEKSIQGHYWTVFGRSSDYTERTWLSTWGRGTRGLPIQGVTEDTRPEEGGIFKWLKLHGVEFDNMGEQLGDVGGRDKSWGNMGFVDPGKARPDTQDACYFAGRARVLCNLKPFTYAWIVNDHTLGAEPGKPNPGLMIAVNDEATGMMLDGLSHSPLWKDSLFIVIEDDPQDGADHVDTHRSIMVMASPWVKRGYVSHGHYDPASLHKLFAHILGLPYNNEMVANAAVPFDLFTSTPDYTPFTYKPRSWQDQSCNPPGTPEAIIAEASHWDWSEADDQPGLSAQVWRMLHHGSR